MTPEPVEAAASGSPDTSALEAELASPPVSPSGVADSSIAGVPGAASAGVAVPGADSHPAIVLIRAAARASRTRGEAILGWRPMGCSFDARNKFATTIPFLRRVLREKMDKIGLE